MVASETDCFCFVEEVHSASKLVGFSCLHGYKIQLLSFRFVITKTKMSVLIWNEEVLIFFLLVKGEMKCVVKGCSGGFIYVNEKWCVYWILMMGENCGCFGLNN